MNAITYTIRVCRLGFSDPYASSNQEFSDLLYYPSHYVHAFSADGPSSSLLLDLPGEVLEQVLTNLSLENLRTSSLVSKRLLDASNTVQKSVTFNKRAGKETLARLAARFRNATAAAFAGKGGCSQIEGIEGVLRSMTRLQSLDLSGLQHEISVQSTLASILRSFPGA
jgi:hypothetical protein